MKNIKYILIQFFLCSITSWAQQPSHFILGEEELAGINIYHLHQDQKGDYWIATNDGIYKYDSYDIKRISCPEMTSSSVFNIIEDYEQNIYFHNLSGQIFTIKNDSCFVYFTIPDSLMSHEMSYEFDNRNQLTITTTKLFQVSDIGELTLLINNDISSSIQLYKDIDSSLILYDFTKSKLIKLKDGNIHKLDIPLESKIHPTFLIHNHKLISYDRRSGIVLPQLSSNPNVKFPEFKYHNNLTRYYSDNTNTWVQNLSGGVYLFDDNQKVKNNYKPLFQTNVISSLFKDNEGNIILGTFGDGLIVITNLDILDMELNSSTTKVNKLTSTSDGQIFLGTQEGEIYEIDSLNEVKLIKEKGNHQIEILEYLKNTNSLIFNGIDKNLINLTDDKYYLITDGSIKDIYQKNEFEYFLATNTGVNVFNSQLIANNINNSAIKKVENFEGRTYCIGFDKFTNSIYCGTALGLKIGNTDSSFFFTLNDKTVLSRDIIQVNDKIILTTKQNGVLLFKNDKLIDNWTVEDGILSNNTKLLKEYDNKLFLSTDLGLNILNKDGKVLSSINKSNGLNANNIVDFEVVNGFLWVLTNKGIQKIKLDKIIHTNYYPSINITNIHVNEKLIDANIHNFNHTQKKFAFEISSKSLKYQNEISYEYQLEGIDENWVLNSYKDHVIEYKSLPPNSYTFKVKSIHKFNESETIYYSFKIEKPYWNRWWFYLTIILSFFIITFIIFRFQSKRQRRKNLLQNQLSLSQLTALKSQMNPHFIFNSLNSIQDLILQEDRENAYNYISKFALLVRKILHHSDKDFIEIEEEVRILTVYLELEELRFKKDFSFIIEANNINDIEIPPMLIQPFVENALKHGLLHKKGNKKLSIIFDLSSEILTCIITDNGIGRQKSSEIKLRQNKTHDSFSIKSITNRFDILKNLYGEEIGVTFEDLHINDQVTGTKVILKIPFKRRF